MDSAAYYRKVKAHFDAAGEGGVRGRRGRSGLLAYAAHLLERLSPSPGAHLLELGCGDGETLRVMRDLRPDVFIDGIELSPVLAAAAQANNPESRIECGNILSWSPRPNAYDVAYSFSVLQYLPKSDVRAACERLDATLVPEGRQVHCSIPDVRFRAAAHLVGAVTRFGRAGYVLFPAIHLLLLARHRGRYGDQGFWHHPQTVARLTSCIGRAETLPSDVFYRFDFSLRKHRA